MEIGKLSLQMKIDTSEVERAMEKVISSIQEFNEAVSNLEVTVEPSESEE